MVGRGTGARGDLTREWGGLGREGRRRGARGAPPGLLQVRPQQTLVTTSLAGAPQKWDCAPPLGARPVTKAPN